MADNVDGASINTFVRHPLFTTRLRQWQDARDCYEGEDAVKLRKSLHLPRPGGMTDDQFAAYLLRAVFYGVTERTVLGLTGTIMRVPPIPQNFPDSIEPKIGKATADGNNLTTLAMRAAIELLTTGRYGILVDMPQGENAEASPYFATYHTEDITNWRTTLVKDEEVVSRVMLREAVVTRGSIIYERFRELLLENGVYIQRIWEFKLEDIEATGEGGEDSTPAVTDIGKPVEEFTPKVRGETLDFIPFVGLTSYDLSFIVRKPPITDLVRMNLAHFRNSADYEHSLFLTACPTPYIIGEMDDKNIPTKIGSGGLWHIASPASDVELGMLEFSGTGIDSIREAMEDKKEQMRAIGAQLIVAGGPAETAEAVKMKNKESGSVLVNTSAALGLGLTRAYQWAAHFAGEPDEVVEEINVKTNTDFVETKLDPAALTALVAAWQDKVVSYETLHRNLQEGEVADPLQTAQDELDKIAEEAEKAKGEEGVGGDNPAEEAMNGAQVTALQALVVAVSAGEMPAKSAEIAALNAFPSIPKEEVEEMFKVAEEFDPSDPDASTGEGEPGEGTPSPGMLKDGATMSLQESEGMFVVMDKKTEQPVFSSGDRAEAEAEFDKRENGGGGEGKAGKFLLTEVNDHTHTVTLDDEGNGTSSPGGENDHTHTVSGGTVAEAEGHTHPLEEA